MLNYVQHFQQILRIWEWRTTHNTTSLPISLSPVAIATIATTAAKNNSLSLFFIAS